MNIGIRIPEHIQAELRQLTEANSDLISWLHDNPEDKITLFLKAQNDYRLNGLQQELFDSFAFYGHSVLSYRFISDINLEITNITRHLNSLQNVINKTLSQVIQKDNGQLPLFFSTVFQGSTGIVLTSAADPEQLLPGIAEETFDTFFKILSKLESKDNNIENIFQKDRTFLRAYRSFFKELANTVCPIDISTKLSRSQEIIHTSKIDREYATNIYNTLAQYEKDNSITIDVMGDVVAINLLEKTIQIIPHSRKGVQIKLFFDDISQEKAIKSLGKIALIQYREDTQFDIETNKISISKHILSLQIQL